MILFFIIPKHLQQRYNIIIAIKSENNTYLQNSFLNIFIDELNLGCGFSSNSSSKSIPSVNIKYFISGKHSRELKLSGKIICLKFFKESSFILLAYLGNTNFSTVCSFLKSKSKSTCVGSIKVSAFCNELKYKLPTFLGNFKFLACSNLDKFKSYKTSSGKTIPVPSFKDDNFSLSTFLALFNETFNF